jgi:hypothetical protein
MEHKQITLIRIHFQRSLPIIEQNFQKKIKEIILNEKERNIILQKKEINLLNYNFLNKINFKEYSAAIKYYNTKIKEIDDNDNTSIILLFFPEFLKAYKLENEIDINNPKFSYKNLSLKNPNSKIIENEIKTFFENYNNIRKRYGFLFSTSDMFNYLEIFLNKHNYYEYDLVKKIEYKEFACLHYFMLFLRPEIFYKEEENLKIKN